MKLFVPDFNLFLLPSPVAKKQEIILFLPAMAWMALIFFMSHMPGGESGVLSQKIADFLQDSGINLFKLFGDKTVWVIRKMAHMTEYGILYILLMLPFRFKKNGKVISLLISVIFAATDEIHQGFIPRRVPSFLDVAFDSLGACFAFGFTYIFGGVFNKKTKLK